MECPVQRAPLPRPIEARSPSPAKVAPEGGLREPSFVGQQMKFRDQDRDRMACQREM